MLPTRADERCGIQYIIIIRYQVNRFSKLTFGDKWINETSKFKLKIKN